MKQKGDSYMHELIMELNKAFITPIEREDIFTVGNEYGRCIRWSRTLSCFI
ncbi:hypothetical protein GCM10020331_068600 [Ectobacillus funiculus]